LGGLVVHRSAGVPEAVSARGRLPARQGAGWARPDGLEPFDEVGAGVREVRISVARGIFRVMYVAKFEETVYVLHCFQKKTQATSKQDKDIAATRYRAVVNARKGK
jgi:phage-related protein